MIPVKRKPPLTERTFASPWRELDYLCKKLRYWLYLRNHKAGAARYRARLSRVLRQLPKNDEAILRQEGQALLGELDGDLGQAIDHRRQEIKLMERLHKSVEAPECSPDARAYVLRDRGKADLEQRRAILEALEKAKSQENRTPRARLR